MCECTCMCTHIIFMYTYIHMHVYAHMYVYMHYVYACICACMYMHVCIPREIYFNIQSNQWGMMVKTAVARSVERALQPGPLCTIRDRHPFLRAEVTPWQDTRPELSWMSTPWPPGPCTLEKHRWLNLPSDTSLTHWKRTEGGRP